MKRLYLFAILLVASVSLMAQEIMKVELTDGRVIEYDVTKVARVYFEESNSVEDDKESYVYADSVFVNGVGLITVKGKATFVDGACTGMSFCYIFSSKSVASNEWKDILEDEDIDLSEYYYDGDKTITWFMNDADISAYATVSKEVVCNIVNNAVSSIIQDLQDSYNNTSNILGNYYTYLNKTKVTIIEQFGNPLFEEDRGLYYAVSDPVVDYCVFSLYEDIDVCQVVSLLLKDNVNNQQIIDLLNSLFYVFEKGTEVDGSFYAWTNKPDLATSTVGITYDPVNKVITYLLLEPSAGVPEKQISNVKKYSKKVRLPIQK